MRCLIIWKLEDMKTINCEYCKKFKWLFPSPTEKLHNFGECTLGNKIRFFKPRHERDDEWGYRKKCLRYDEDVNK